MNNQGRPKRQGEGQQESSGSKKPSEEFQGGGNTKLDQMLQINKSNKMRLTIDHQI